ncbi:MAG: hypothetical protein P8176_02590 [Gammaproteobacteria bacterium]
MRHTAQRFTLLIDLVDCCITQNYWDQILVYFWTQSIFDYVSARWSLYDIQHALSEIAHALGFESDIDRAGYCEHITRCIQNDLWPKGLDHLLSSLTLVGIESGYLSPQTHSDTVTSFKRWREKGWKVIVVHELSVSTQHQLLEKAQSPRMLNTLSGCISLCADPDSNLHKDLLLQHNLTWQHRKTPRTAYAIISSRQHLLNWGKQNGYHPLRLNRRLNPDSPTDAIPHIIDLNFADLLLSVS